MAYMKPQLFPSLEESRTAATPTNPDLIAQLLEGAGMAVPTLPPVKRPEGVRGLFAPTPPAIPMEAREQLGAGGMAPIQDVSGESTDRLIANLALLASIFTPLGLVAAPIFAGRAAARRDQKTQDIDRALTAAGIAGKAKSGTVKPLDIEMQGRSFLMSKFDLDDPAGREAAKTYWRSEEGQKGFQEYLNARFPMVSYLPQYNPETGEVTMKAISGRTGEITPTGITKPKELVPSARLDDWSKAFNAKKNVQDMLRLSQGGKVPFGVPGWLINKALSGEKTQAVLAELERFSGTTIIPPEAMQYYAAFTNFVVAAQSIIKGIPSNYDVKSLLKTIGTMVMSPQQRETLINYSYALMLRALEHEIALQKAAGRSVPLEMEELLRSIGVDPSRPRLKAYEELPTPRKMQADVLKELVKKPKDAQATKKSTKSSAGASSTKGKLTPEQKADQFLEESGLKKMMRL